MPTHSLPDRGRLFNVSVSPRFLCDSGRVGWHDAFFASVICAPAGTVDQLHEPFCLTRVLAPLEVRARHRSRWQPVPARIRVWSPGAEQRATWRGGGRAQFLFVATDRVARVLDGSAARELPGGPVRSRAPNLCFDALEADLLEGSPAGPLVGDALITALIAQVAALPGPRRDRLRPAARARVLAYMEAHLDRPLRLADLAGVAEIGVRQFSRAFFASTDESPHQYLLRLRIERAKTLIATEVPLAEVAQQCGFADQSQLTRTFARRAGITPARYRAALRG